jgi:hypothetical protein
LEPLYYIRYHTPLNSYDFYLTDFWWTSRPYECIMW